MKKKTEKRFLPNKIQTGILNTIVHTTYLFIMITIKELC